MCPNDFDMRANSHFKPDFPQVSIIQPLVARYIVNSMTRSAPRPTCSSGPVMPRNQPFGAVVCPTLAVTTASARMAIFLGHIWTPIQPTGPSSRRQMSRPSRQPLAVQVHLRPQPLAAPLELRWRTKVAAMLVGL
jgi:hypothetical protein